MAQDRERAQWSAEQHTRMQRAWEKLEKAYEEGGGRPPSGSALAKAARIDKTTALAWARARRADEADDVPAEVETALAEMAAPLVRQIWKEVTTRIEAAHADEIKAAATDRDEAVARAETAEKAAAEAHAKAERAEEQVEQVQAETAEKLAEAEKQVAEAAETLKVAEALKAQAESMQARLLDIMAGQSDEKSKKKS